MSTVSVVDQRPDRTKTYQPPKPILDRIRVKRLEAATEVDGFEIADKYREASRLGEVIAIGDYVVLGDRCCKLTDFVNVGDRVLFGEHSAEAIDHTDPRLATIFNVRIRMFGMWRG